MWEVKVLALAIITLIFSVNLKAQEAARVIQAFGDSCPLTAGGLSNPINQARNSIARSSELLANIQADRDGDSCHGDIRFAQQQMAGLNPQQGTAGQTTQPQGSTGFQPQPINGTPDNTPISTDATYQRAFQSLLNEDRIAYHENEIQRLRHDFDDAENDPQAQMRIQGEISTHQSAINSIRLEERVASEGHRLTVYNHAQQAGQAFIRALGSCQSAPEMMVQLAPAALNLSSSLGAIDSGAALAINAITGIISEIVQFFRNRDIDEAQEGLENAYASTAVRCAYLTMGQQYCQAVDLQSRFFQEGGNPQTRLQGDTTGLCHLRGFNLLSQNVTENGGLASTISSAVSAINQFGTSNFSETQINRIIAGSGGNGGLRDRIHQIDNYYHYVENNIESSLSRMAGIINLIGTDTERGQEMAREAVRLRQILLDVRSRKTRTHELRNALDQYHNATALNFDPNVSNEGALQNLRVALGQFTSEENSSQLFESDLQSIVDWHKEGISIIWGRELKGLDRYADGVVPPTSEIRRANQLSRRLNVITNASQTEAMRQASLELAGLTSVDANHQRESVARAVQIQLENLQTMGRFLKPQLNRQIKRVHRRMNQTSDQNTRLNLRIDLLGLCESTLNLPPRELTSDMREACGDIIYRNEGNNNITFSQMYGRVSEQDWNMRVACDQHRKADNVARDNQ